MTYLFWPFYINISCIDPYPVKQAHRKCNDILLLKIRFLSLPIVTETEISQQVARIHPSIRKLRKANKQNLSTVIITCTEYTVGQG